MKSAITTIVLAGLILALAPTDAAAEQKLQEHTISSWNKYIALTQERIKSDLNSPAKFQRNDIARLKQGDILIETVTTTDKGKTIEIKDGAIHHWRGAIFIPDVTVDELLTWVQDYNRYKDFFAEVEDSKLLSRPDPETFDIFLRLSRTKLGVTAKFKTNHIVEYRRHDSDHVSSRSVATKIAQLEKAGTPAERELPPGEDSGYLWRLNSYWRFSKVEGGVVADCETIGLSRSLDSWVINVLNFMALGRIKKVANSIAHDSLEGMLTGLRDGVRETKKTAGAQ